MHEHCGQGCGSRGQDPRAILPEQAEKLQQLYSLMNVKKSDIVTIALNDLLSDEERVKTIIEKAKVIRRIK